MLLMELKRLEPGPNACTMIMVNLNLVCAAAPYLEKLKEGKTKLHPEQTILCLANGMVIHVDKPYKSIHAAMSGYNPR